MLPSFWQMVSDLLIGRYGYANDWVELHKPLNFVRCPHPTPMVLQWNSPELTSESCASPLYTYETIQMHRQQIRTGDTYGYVVFGKCPTCRRVYFATESR